MEKDKIFISGKTIFGLSIGVLIYLSFLFLNSNTFKLDYVIIGVLQEILTIPIIIGQLILLIFAYLNFRKDNYSLRSYGFLSLIVLIITNVFIWGSFILK